MADQRHRRNDSVSSTTSLSSVSSTASIPSSVVSASSTYSDWVHVNVPMATPSPPPLFTTPVLSPATTPLKAPASPGGRRHSVGLNLAPSLCDFNPSPHRPTHRPQLRPLILAAKYPLDPSVPLL